MSRACVVSSLIVAVACSACSGRPSQGVLIPVSLTSGGEAIVPVLAATTRRPTADPGEMFSGDRGSDVLYASVAVSIPPDSVRQIGEIQWPASIPGDPARNFVTVSADYIDRSDFVRRVAASAGRSGGRVLVFVHGFNNRFDDAVYRFAQIVHDARTPAVPILFTWPSRGELRLRAYTYDRESANYSRDAFEELLESISRIPTVTEVNVLAHSMGNWVTLEALRARSIRTGVLSGKVKNVMLVAPDVDVDVFRAQIKRMGARRPRFALFVSQDDQALALSKSIWGGIQRLGEVNPDNEPYRAEFEQAHIEVFNLTKLKRAGDDAHNRAFEDVTSVMTLIKQRMAAGQQLSDRSSVGPLGGL